MTKRRLNNPLIAIAYIRVSKNEQELGLEAQQAALIKWAESQGVSIAAWCVDQGVKSYAPLEDRPALLDAVARLSHDNAGLLLVARRDRLARDVIVAGLIERAVESAGAKVFSADGGGNGDSPTDVFAKQILTAAAQLERALIAARTRAALAAKKARGEPTGRPPIAATIAPETLALIRSLYHTGFYSHAALAEELNDRKIPTASGKGSWWKRTVREALQIESNGSA